jgi:hypothetical protein
MRLGVSCGRRGVRSWGGGRECVADSLCVGAELWDDYRGEVPGWVVVGWWVGGVEDGG